MLSLIKFPIDIDIANVLKCYASTEQNQPQINSPLYKQMS
jgi:hypothetical protein